MNITEQDIAAATTGELLDNVHPGEILLHDFLEPEGMTKNALAVAIKVPASRIGEIVRGARAISADTDIRLSRFFGTSEGYWLRLQAAYDLMEAHRLATYDEIRPRAA